MQEQAVPAAKPRKPRLAAIEYIRGISMMGVIGIHVGSQYLSNTAANVELVMNALGDAADDRFQTE
jgi:peptidoglycan/LPS O-acetylase OafA/YrhL